MTKLLQAIIAVFVLIGMVVGALSYFATAQEFKDYRAENLQTQQKLNEKFDLEIINLRLDIVSKAITSMEKECSRSSVNCDRQKLSEYQDEKNKLMIRWEKLQK